MKQLIFFFMVGTLLVSSACSKKSSSGTAAVQPEGVYRGVVLFSVCSHTVIQAIGSPNTLGQETWTADSYGTPQVYHHVFAVQNGCQFTGHSQGDTISFRLIQPQVQDCITCMIGVAIPDSSYAIKAL